MTSYYAVLGVSKDATPDEVKRAYRKKALEAHPDKGGTAERISELNEAYSALSNPVRRAQYDAEGKVEPQHGFQVDPFQFFRDFFSNSESELRTPRRTHDTQRRVQRPEDICSTVDVPFEHLFHGRTKKLAVRRQRFCADCDGRGVPSDVSVATCSQCRGQGKTFTTVTNFLGEMTSSSFCTLCKGTGIKVAPGTPVCATCKGKRMVEERAIVELVIEPGTPDEWQACCAGEGNDSLLAMGARGDVLLRVCSSLPPGWRRRGQHLMHEEQVGVGECVGGHSLLVHHPSGEQLHIQVDGVLRPTMFVNGKLTSVWVVDGKGMPEFHDEPKGHLFLLFAVLFPTHTLDLPREVSSLFQCEKIDSDKETCDVRPATPKEQTWVQALEQQPAGFRQEFRV